MHLEGRFACEVIKNLKICPYKYQNSIFSSLYRVRGKYIGICPDPDPRNNNARARLIQAKFDPISD